MENNNKLTGYVREKVGKGDARKLRTNEMIPAIIYGDKKEPLPIALPKKEVTMRIHSGGFMTNILEINVEGQTHQALPKDFQVHPVKENIMHVDLLRVSESTIVTVEVPVQFTHEDVCPGIKTGGVLNIVRHRVEVTCPATSIPEAFVVSLEEAQLGESINISAVELPQGVQPTITDRDFTIATIATPAALRAEEEETPEAAEGEGEEGAEGETETTGETKEGEEKNKDDAGGDKAKE